MWFLVFFFRVLFYLEREKTFPGERIVVDISPPLHQILFVLMTPKKRRNIQ